MGESGEIDLNGDEIGGWKTDCTKESYENQDESAVQSLPEKEPIELE